MLKQAERCGELEVIQFITEPECHRSVGTISLTPDAYVEVGDRIERVKRAFFLEVDRSTEHADKIEDKCVRYWRAFQMWPEEFFPMVVFVVRGEARAAYIQAVARRGPRDAQFLFQTCTSQALGRSIGVRNKT